MRTKWSVEIPARASLIGEPAYMHYDAEVGENYGPGEPCEHAFEHRTDEHARSDGSVYTNRCWKIPRLLQVPSDCCGPAYLCMDCFDDAITMRT